ncbi:RsbR, positive regulator of sigma-B [Bacillus sp. JCM 19045]|nr:RsbR, positive regulator of sigma-B [Bacillus sp. JCM 19045]
MTFYEFMKARTWDLVELWYEEVDKTQGDIYGTTIPERIERLKQQNHGFHIHFCEIFRDDSTLYSDSFNQWITDVAHDSTHQSADIDIIMKQFFVIEEYYLEFLRRYALEITVTNEELSEHTHLIVKGFNEIVLRFTKSHLSQNKQTFEAHQQLVAELSSPIIHLSTHVSLLPIVGDIDTYRAKVIFDETLQKCNSAGITELVIDLSGVVMIDTMVANQIFQLMSGLRLIGTKTSLVGIRPEIAQTAVQLQIDFSAISIYPSLKVAIRSIGL